MTNAERQRRYRERKRAEQQQQAPAVTTPPVTPPVTVTLGTRGRRLWQEMSGDTLESGKRVLLEEACRIADRLDRLDALLAGDADAWLRFTVDESGTEVTVNVDKALSEARQQAVALKQLVAELRQGAATAKPETGGSVLDQLAAKRAARLANTPG